MPKAKDGERRRWWSAQRSYHYDSHDADGNFNGLTEEEWKKQILEEWSARRLRAYHVTVIFHDKDTEVDDHGNVTLKDLHAHLCVYFINAHTDTAVMQVTGCSRLENVKVIEKNRRSRAYRYLLHVSEGAIDDGKHIYSEDELIISKSADDVKYDYHKYIKASEEDEQVKEEKDILKKTVRDILDGVYDGDEELIGDVLQRKYGPLDKLLRDEKISRLIGVSPTNERIIKNALKTRKEMLRAEELWNMLQNNTKDKQ